MKASLFIAFLAVYGCVAQESAEAVGNEDAAVSSDEAAAEVSSSSGITVGGMLGKIDSYAQNFLEGKKTIVNDGLTLGDNIVQSTLDLANSAIEEGTTLAGKVIGGSAQIGQDAISAGEKITDQALDLVGKVPVFGSKIASGGKLISKLSFGAASKAIAGAEKVGKGGVSLGNLIGQKATGAVGVGSTFVKEAGIAVEGVKTGAASKLVSKGVSATSSGIQGFGNGVASVGKWISSSAAIKA